jgi:hypothetical protein
MPKGQKHKTPNRPFLDLQDSEIPWDQFEDERDKLFPENAPPVDFRFKEIRDAQSLWDQSRGAAWAYIVGKWKAENTAQGAAIVEHLRILASDIHKINIRFDGLDPECVEALTTALRDSNSNQEYTSAVDQVTNLARWCEWAAEIRARERVDPGYENELEFVIELGRAWNTVSASLPSASINGPFYSFVYFIGERLGLEISENMALTAIKRLTPDPQH